MVLLRTQKLLDAGEAVNELLRAGNALHSAVLERLHAEWRDAGGCEKCRGRGWVVVWDTLDSLSGCYHESGPCPNPDCTPESRERTGFQPGHNKYDQYHEGATVEPMDSVNATEKLAQARIKFELKAARAHEDAIKEQSTVRKGVVLKVVLGRKVPQGTVGRVFWLGVSYGKPRVGLKDSSGEVFWTALSNCELA